MTANYAPGRTVRMVCSKLRVLWASRTIAITQVSSPLIEMYCSRNRHCIHMTRKLVLDSPYENHACSVSISCGIVPRPEYGSAVIQYRVWTHSAANTNNSQYV